MTRVEFEPTISAGERTQTYALDRATTGMDIIMFIVLSLQPYPGLSCGLLSVILSVCKFVPITPSIMRTIGAFHTAVTCDSYTSAHYEPLLYVFLQTLTLILLMWRIG
jgi:hypothetical protein